MAIFMVSPSHLLRILESGLKSSYFGTFILPRAISSTFARFSSILARISSAVLAGSVSK
jgi:hypothetical protein